MSNRQLKAIDLCCVAGGWAAAARGLPIDWVCVADLAADCLETWQLNHGTAHPDCLLLERDLSAGGVLAEMQETICDVDLICGAIPCEQVSTARANRALREGEIEQLHAIIDGIWHIVREYNPRWWVLEDVAAILPHLPSPLFDGMAYVVRSIDASCYGPQKRVRIFIGEFPPPAAPEPGPRTLGEVLRPGPHRTLPQLAKYQRSKSKWYGGDKIRVQDPAGPGATVISSQGGNGIRGERSGMVPLARVLDASQASPTVTQMGRKGDRSCLIAQPAEERPLYTRERAQLPDAPSRTVCSGKGGRDMTVAASGTAQSRCTSAAQSAPCVTSSARCDPREVVTEDLVRVMEWQEAAALQGFPDDYLFAASWSRTWKLISQAIPIQVGRALLQAIVADWRAAGG